MVIDFDTLKTACRYSGKDGLCSKPPNFGGRCDEEMCPLKKIITDEYAENLSKKIVNIVEHARENAR